MKPSYYQYRQQGQWLKNAIALLDQAQLHIDDEDNEAYTALHAIRMYIGEMRRLLIYGGWS